MKPINIGFMASHGGSNMQAVLDAIKSKKLTTNPVYLSLVSRIYEKIRT